MIGLMRRRLPSIRALESFEAVHRYGNVTRAAEELGRTQSAVSRQIANLEEFIGHELFLRDRKQLTLNPPGERFYEKIVTVLNSLQEAINSQANEHSSDQTLRLGVLPYFATRWLMPRLKRYAYHHDKTELHLVKGLGRNDFEHYNVDVAIECSFRQPVGVVSHLLLDEELVATISPEVYHSKNAKPLPQLYMPARSYAWELWAQHRDTLPLEGKIKFENYAMMIESACLGMGITIAPTIYVEQEIESGRLIAPFGPPLESGRKYWLTYPDAHAEKYKVRTFIDWLVSHQVVKA